MNTICSYFFVQGQDPVSPPNPLSLPSSSLQEHPRLEAPATSSTKTDDVGQKPNAGGSVS
jgi:hypothetical protein